MGGGAMLRAAGRAIGAGIGPGAVSTVMPKPTSFLSVPSSSSSSATLPVSVASTSASRPPPASRFVDEDDWEHVQEHEDVDDGVSGFSHRHVFGPVPSKKEVETALSALQQVIVPATYSETVENRFASSINLGSDLAEPALHFYTPRAEQLQSYDRIFDAFHLLQTNTSVQRMVVSLSSDKALWDAVMNNEAVKELKESFYSGKINQLESSEEGPQVAGKFLTWILDNIKARIGEIIDRIMRLMNDLFRPTESERATDIFKDTLGSSVMLSIMVLLVVVVTRAQST